MLALWGSVGLALLSLPGVSHATDGKVKRLEAIEPGTWVTDDDYPPEALRLHQAGQVEFVISVAGDGAPKQCWIVQGSGSTILDNATCPLLMSRAKFAPARDASGSPIEATYRSRFHWNIPGQVPIIYVTIAPVAAGYRCTFNLDGEKQMKSAICKKIAATIAKRLGYTIGTFPFGSSEIVSAIADIISD